jgi:DNA repair protein RecO (recombination protein O)
MTAVGRHRERPREMRAFLLERRAFGEADLLVTLLTDGLGRVTAVARHAKQSRRRFAGALEPLHTLRVELARRENQELFGLRQAHIEVSRQRLMTDLEAMEAAGRALRWLKQASAPELCEPALFGLCERLLDALERAQRPANVVLGEYVLELINQLGWGLELERCVGCGKTCQPERVARVSPERGGLVCQRCGSANTELHGPLRARLQRAALGRHPSLEPADAPLAISLGKAVFKAHGGDWAQ